MQDIHLPTLSARYWVALCVASVFGANMGDFFARDIGLGHIAVEGSAHRAVVGAGRLIFGF